MDQARCDRAVGLQASGRLEEAIQEFHLMAAEASDPNEKATMMLWEGKSHALAGHLSEAEAILAQAQALAPDDVIRINVDFGAACVAFQAGKHEDALGQYREMVRRYAEMLKSEEYRPLSEEIRHRIAFSMVHVGRYNDALSILEQIISFPSLGPEFQQEAHLYLGICYEEEGKEQQAIKQFLRTVEFNFKNSAEANARFRAGQLYFLNGGAAQAKQQLEAALQIDQTEIDRKSMYKQLSSVCRYLGETENEIRYTRLAEEDIPSRLRRVGRFISRRPAPLD